MSSIRESGFGEYSGAAPADMAKKKIWEEMRFLTTVSDAFSEQVLVKKGDLEAAFAAVTADASDPTALAKYQAALGEYTLYRNAQSNAVKAYKDVDANTIRNFN